ncbi:primosomal protein N' [Patescibacteria group bacterium]|nr:primosomal protein N' [Patescibacteria group bacterium]
MTYYFDIIPLTNVPLKRGTSLAEKRIVYGFTYSSQEKLLFGQEVVIVFGRIQCTGIVYREVKNPSFKRIKGILGVVSDAPRISKKQFSLAEFVSNYYLTNLGLVLKLMLPRKVKKRSNEKSLDAEVREEAHKLTGDQKKAADKIIHATQSHKNDRFLLLGPTASGKTEVYMRAIKEALGDNGQVLLLVPEISLVPQNIERFQKRFSKDAIAVLHSRLTAGERYFEWDRIKNGDAQIVIGPRSALFAPAENIRLIIIDEEHDVSFKQYDQNPRYNAITVAEKMSDLFNAPLVLGSATPNVETYNKAEKKEYTLLELSERIHQKEMPEVLLVNMKEEFKKKNFSVFSEVLQEKLSAILTNKRQALLFINRRGTATFVSCRECGYVATCGSCDIPFTYHLYSDFKGLVCHHCGKREAAPTACPECNSTAIKYVGGGTEKVERELKTLFPKARIGRMDKDTTAVKHAHKKIYDDFCNHRIDFLIGTQMITKGWDIPKVDLVGVVSADIGLNFPDFRATEQTFQLLTQVAGRTGRKDSRGTVVLQTYYPENTVFGSVAHHNFQSFYKTEIKERKDLGYPPFSKLIKLIFEHVSQETALHKGTQLIDLLEKSFAKESLKCDILGPAPAFIPKVRGKNRVHIILKFSKSSQNKIKEVLSNTLDQNWKIDVDPVNLL